MRSWRNDKLWARFGCDRFWFLLVLRSVCMSKIEKEAFLGLPLSHIISPSACVNVYFWHEVHSTYVKREVGRNSLYFFRRWTDQKIPQQSKNGESYYLVWNVPESIPTYVEAHSFVCFPSKYWEISYLFVIIFHLLFNIFFPLSFFLNIIYVCMCLHYEKHLLETFCKV